jgi:ketopantoate hydroxymethyltransferase
MKKIIVSFFLLAVVLASAAFVATPVETLASSANEIMWDNQMDKISGNIGLSNRDPRVIIASIINVVLGFLGIIAVVIIVLGGFKWMTAGGNEDKVDEAKKLITAGAIGLVIIMASWGIARFVINAVYSSTTG